MTIQEWSGIDSPFATDAECIQLLPVLVERGYVNTELSYHNMHWWLKIQKMGYRSPVYFAMKPSISEAITAAIIQLIDKEA